MIGNPLFCQMNLDGNWLLLRYKSCCDRDVLSAAGARRVCCRARAYYIVWIKILRESSLWHVRNWRVVMLCANFMIILLSNAILQLYREGPAIGHNRARRLLRHTSLRMVRSYGMPLN